MDPILTDNIIKLGMAVLVGGLIGAEREYQDKADILALLEKNKSVDLKKVRAYADMFNEWPAIEDLLKRL